MKICMFVDNSITNDARVKNEAYALSRAGHQVTVFGVLDSRSPKEETWEDIRFIRMEERLSKFQMLHIGIRAVWKGRLRRDASKYCFCIIRDAMLRRALVKRALKTDFDVFHAHDVFRLEAASICAKAAGKPLVYDSHEYFEESYFTSRENVKPYYTQLMMTYLDVQQKLIQSASLVITVSQGIARAMQKQFELTKTPTVVYNCPQFRERKTSNAIRERHLHSGDDRKIILYQGALLKGRGLERFVALAQSVSEADFVIIGPAVDKAYASEIDALSQQAGNVHILPPVAHAELWEITHSADFGYSYIEPIHKSYEMAAPNKTFEYLAAGLPIFTINTTGTREIISQIHGDNPLFILPENLDDAASYIQQTIKRDDLQRYRDAAYTLAKTVFNRDIEAGKLVRSYQNITNTAAGGKEAIPCANKG